MEFKKKIMNHQVCYVSGIYKCIEYGGNWLAYFKPFGWKNWGNSCERNSKGNSVSYTSLKEAKEACERHLAKFGSNPEQNDRIHTR